MNKNIHERFLATSWRYLSAPVNALGNGQAPPRNSIATPQHGGFIVRPSTGIQQILRFSGVRA